MSYGVTPCADFKLAIPEKNVISWRTPFMVVLLEPPVKPMTRAHGQIELFKYLTFLEPLQKCYVLLSFGVTPLN